MAHATGNTSHSRSPPLRVFMVEDSTNVRDALSEQLNDIQGVCVVGSADSEREAVTALRLTPCDVAILDIKLREGSGIGVLRALGPAFEQHPVCIIFSNYTESQYRALAAQLGAAHFFDKSCDLRALIALVSSLSRNV